MLREFVNIQDEKGAVRFVNKWGQLRKDHPPEKLVWASKLFKKIWNQELSTAEIEDQLELVLGMNVIEQNGEHVYLRPAMGVDWTGSRIRVKVRDLFDSLAVTLLVNSKRLRICANKACPARYFIARRSDQKYCPGDCVQIGQAESKKRWWKESGGEWLQSRKKSKRQRRGRRR